jgi:hypothetical protein
MITKGEEKLRKEKESDEEEEKVERRRKKKKWKGEQVKEIGKVS